MPLPPADLLFSQLQALVLPELGATLLFSGHEDGSRLEPFIWRESEQGALSGLTLMQSEGWSRSLTLAEAVEAWQKPDQVGTVNGEDWLRPDGDPAQILLSDDAKMAHQALDAELLKLLQARLQNLEALQLSCDGSYTFVLITGQIGQHWISIAPTVPVATPVATSGSLVSGGESPPAPLKLTALPSAGLDAAAAISDAAAMLQLQIQDLLTRRGSTRLYGYYGGGYNQTHDYRLVQAAGATQVEAVQALMLATGLLQISQFEAFQPTDPQAELAAIQQVLQPLQPKVYQFSFWDWEQVYIIGAIGAQDERFGSDLIGVVLRSHFTYNP